MSNFGFFSIYDAFSIDTPLGILFKLVPAIEFSLLGEVKTWI